MSGVPTPPMPIPDMATLHALARMFPQLLAVPEPHAGNPIGQSTVSSVGPATPIDPVVGKFNGEPMLRSRAQNLPVNPLTGEINPKGEAAVGIALGMTGGEGPRKLPEGLTPPPRPVGALQNEIYNQRWDVPSSSSEYLFQSAEAQDYRAKLDAARQLWSNANSHKDVIKYWMDLIDQPDVLLKTKDKYFRFIQKAREKYETHAEAARKAGIDPEAPFPLDERYHPGFKFPGKYGAPLTPVEAPAPTGPAAPPTSLPPGLTIVPRPGRQL